MQMKTSIASFFPASLQMLKRCSLASIVFSSVAIGHASVNVTPTVVFEQNFDSGSDLADYSGAELGQFDAIVASGSNFTWSVSNDGLLGTRTTSNVGALIKTDLAIGSQSALGSIYSFDFQTVGTPTANLSTAFTFLVGSEFGSDTSLPDNSSVHSRFSIYLSTDGSWTIRDTAAGVNAAELYSGKQRITFVLNSSDSEFSYSAPTGTSVSLSANAWDVWVGDSLALSGRGATTASVDPSDFKIRFAPNSTISAAILLDNIQVSSLQATSIPEPSATAMLLGVISLGAVAMARRTRV